MAGIKRLKKRLNKLENRKPAKKISGNTAKLKKLNELESVNKQIGERFKTSEKLFKRKATLMEQLGIDG